MQMPSGSVSVLDHYLVDVRSIEPDNKISACKLKPVIIGLTSGVIKDYPFRYHNIISSSQTILNFARSYHATLVLNSYQKIHETQCRKGIFGFTNWMTLA